MANQRRKRRFPAPAAPVEGYLGINFVDVALRIAPVEFVEGLLRREIVRGRHNAKLRSAVEKLRQGLAHRGERLVESRRHISEILFRQAARVANYRRGVVADDEKVDLLEKQVDR